MLDRFCAPLCQVIHAGDAERPKDEKDFDAWQFIQRLVEANLFVIALDDQGYWFRYHHLFQGFLQNLLKKQASPETIAGLHRHASNWFADNGLIDEAIRHALAAGDTKTAVRLVVDHRYDLLNTSQFTRLFRWLRSLPENAIAGNPLLLMAQAFLGFEIGPDSDIYTCVEQARCKVDVLPAGSPDASMLSGELATMRSLKDVIQGQPASSSANAQKALQLLPKHAFFIRSYAVAGIAAAHQMEGNWSQGVKVLRDALAKSECPAAIRTRIWLYLCAISFMDADSSGVFYSGRHGLKISESTSFIQPRSNIQYYLGATHYLRNELAEAKII
jgi:LuxR family maltose regulon positive regulatory protein